MTNYDMNGRVALVTGGGRGLGRAFAQSLASAGAAVAVSARTEAQLAETVELISVAGGRAIAVPADVSEPSAVERAVAATEQQLGPVNLLVNNAGVPGPMATAWEADLDEWTRTIEVNVNGPLMCARAVLPGMVARRGGRIINITSGAATFPFLYASAYGTSKAALTFLTNTLAGETRQYGVSVFAYAPGMVRTTMLEYAMSDESHSAVREMFERAIAERGLTSLERSVEMFMFLASGRADPLSGRHISVNDDENDLLSRIDQIQSQDLYTLRLRK